MTMLAMTSLELARWQFAITTVFHFWLVPVTIGMAFLVAILQTLAYRTQEPLWERATQFFGKLMLISFAVGVVTGIVQEFQFGMNWSNYSRFVGDIFGAPLAMEALIAFFLESTFIGIWLFGRGKVSPKIHLASIWALSIGTIMSAYFILAANSFMQHPVGYKINEVTGRMELESIWKVLTNSTTLFAFPHTILGALATGGTIMLAVCAWHLARRNEVELFTRVTRLLLPFVILTVGINLIVGHFNGQLMTRQQPMKMAAAEGLRETERGASLSVFSIAGFERNPTDISTPIAIPKLLSLMSTDSFNGTVRGANDIGREYAERFGGEPEDYVPFMPITYWNFRIMIGAGLLMLLVPMLAAIALRRGRLQGRTTLLRLMVPMGVMGLVANSAGWIFTEVGRQPWVVHNFLKTSDANSPTVGAASIWVTLLGYTLIYSILGGIALVLFVRESRHGPADAVIPRPTADQPDLVMTY